MRNKFSNDVCPLEHKLCCFISNRLPKTIRPSTFEIITWNHEVAHNTRNNTRHEVPHNTRNNTRH